jgi:hypothetical protein
MAGSLPGPGAPAGVLAAVWIGLAGCGPEPVGPTEQPSELSAPSTAPALKPVASAGIVPTSATHGTEPKLNFSDEIADLRSRFLPTLEPQAREALAAALEDLATRAAAADPAGAAIALGRGADALREGDAGPADLDALRRTLAAMQAALPPTSSDHLTRSGGTDDPRAR